MVDQLTGHVASIRPHFRGGSLAADASVGDVTIYVEDVADFAEEGGTLRIAKGDGTFLAAQAYTAIDDDTDSITLAVGLAAAASDGAQVRLVDADGNDAVDYEATVVDDSDDSVATVDVAHGLIPLLTASVRSGFSEAVVCTRDEHGAWTLTDVPGKRPTSTAPHGQLTQAGGTTVPDSTPTTLIYDTRALRGGMTVSSGVVTVPTDGRYAITANVAWEANATGYRRVWIQYNGAASGAEARVNAVTGGVPTAQSLSQILDMSAGDTVNVELSQNSTATRTVTATVTVTGLD